MIKSILIAASYSVLILISCKEKEPVQYDEISAEKIATFVGQTDAAITEAFKKGEENARISEAEPMILNYNIVIDRNTGKMTVMNFENGGTIFPIGDMSTLWTVDCTIGGETTSEECDGKWACGTLIADCPEQGGCATICGNPAEFINYKAWDMNSLSDFGLNSTQILSLLGSAPVIPYSDFLQSVNVHRVVWVTPPN